MCFSGLDYTKLSPLLKYASKPRIPTSKEYKCQRTVKVTIAQAVPELPHSLLEGVASILLVNGVPFASERLMRSFKSYGV